MMSLLPYTARPNDYVDTEAMASEIQKLVRIQLMK